ncbi:hypothetical protein V7654_14335 [Bacillus sp. JJ1609]|uniref:hypothetical protein n=1 Tax=Bacillus sp. JJ1609 TaxID=3122977 RepID=UPI002FFD745A
MKKLAGFLVLVVIVYAIYNDLSAGTLPAANMQKIETVEKEVKKQKEEKGTNIPYFEHEVKPGDTVLSVLDSNSKSQLAVPISQAVADFKLLNGGTDPQKIKFGKTYKFPDYSKGN